MMKEIFETFKPGNSLIAKYVDYYYLDIKPGNTINKFDCFPHFNNTISLYRSHKRLKGGEIAFVENAGPLQIFTPVREKVLHVKQTGEVCRIVIVFHPLGIQQFYNLRFTDFIEDFAFFTEKELAQFFSTTNTNALADMLDKALQMRFKRFDDDIVENAIRYIFKNYEHFSVAEISIQIGISRQHLNRLFRSRLGVSVKKFHEIIVFRQTMNEKLFGKPDANFTRLAYEFSYADQSHFIKTYKNLTNYAPRTFFTKGTVLGKADTFWHLQP